MAEDETINLAKTELEIETNEEHSDERINVSIGKLPGKIKEVVVGGRKSVEDALAAANIDLDNIEGYELRVNNVNKTLNDILSEGDRVFLVRKIEGN